MCMSLPCRLQYRISVFLKHFVFKVLIIIFLKGKQFSLIAICGMRIVGCANSFDENIFFFIYMAGLFHYKACTRLITCLWARRFRIPTRGTTYFNNDYTLANSCVLWLYPWCNQIQLGVWIFRSASWDFTLMFKYRYILIIFHNLVKCIKYLRILVINIRPAVNILSCFTIISFIPFLLPVVVDDVWDEMKTVKKTWVLVGR